MPLDITTSCYHWLLCLALFFGGNSAEVSNISPEVASAFFYRSVQQVWVEYDKGFRAACRQSKVNQAQRQKCAENARRSLSTWLNKEVDACLKAEVPKDSGLNNRSCRPAAEAVFTYIIRLRESN